MGSFGWNDYPGERDGYSPGPLEQAAIDAEIEVSQDDRIKSTGYKIIDIGTLRAVISKDGITVHEASEQRPESTEEMSDAS